MHELSWLPWEVHFTGRLPLLTQYIQKFRVSAIHLILFYQRQLTSLTCSTRNGHGISVTKVVQLLSTMSWNWIPGRIPKRGGI